MRWNIELTNLGPFWFPYMFSSLGLSGSAGLMVGIIVIFSILPTILIQWKGQGIREKQSENDLDQLTRSPGRDLQCQSLSVDENKDSDTAWSGR
jgi:hypothetical protein